MTIIANYLSATDTTRPEMGAAIYDLLGISGPGAYALREPDGRLMVWASEHDSEDDDGARATYRSRHPITDAEWLAVTQLAWIDEYDG